MIFIEISLEKMLTKYPELEIEEEICDECGRKRRTTIPFIEKEWVGLKAPKCPCLKAGDFEIRLSKNDVSSNEYQEFINRFN
jgi:hypothetical protein